MKRRTPRGRPESATPTPGGPRSARRKPAWNAYLTDDAQYKLNQQQQLQRALQQLSTAHFSARSPAASASRRRVAAHSSAWSTPQDPEKSRGRSVSRTRLADVQDTGELKTARRLQFADVSMDLEEPTPGRRAAAVSFQVEESQEQQRMDPEQKASLQGELEVLERMLWELETETDRLSWQQTPQKMKMQRQKEVEQTVEEQEREYEQEVVQEQEESGEGEEAEGDDAQERLGDVCYKSLEIGLELARKMETMKKELDNERRLREDRDMKIEMLEQEIRSTQAKCNYVEAKYQSVASQVEGMREAVIATEEAIHRMTAAFEFSQRRRGKVSNPSTPNKPATPRPTSIYSNEPVKVSKKAATPNKAGTPKKPSTPIDQQENWTPNGQR